MQTPFQPATATGAQNETRIAVAFETTRPVRPQIVEIKSASGLNENPSFIRNLDSFERGVPFSPLID